MPTSVLGRIMSTYEVLLLAILFAIKCHGAQRKPVTDYFEICKKSEPSSVLDQCIKKSMMKLKATLNKGIPEIGLPSIEPLRINRLEFAEGQSNFKFTQVLTNLKIHGMGNYEVKDVRSNFKQLTFNTTLFNKKIDFEGNYEMDGQVLILPIKGNGDVTYNFTDVTTHFVTNLEKYEKNGIEYIRVKKIKMTISPERAQSYFTNLFNGDKTLGAATNKFLNDNWKETFTTFRHLPESAFAEVLKSMSNRVYDAFPLKELFPNGL